MKDGEALRLFRIGEIARRSGVSSRTIDYYTQIGLLHSVKRTPGKHRLYSEDVLKTIDIIKQLQKHHFTLKEISDIFEKSSCEIFQEADMAMGIKKIFEQMESTVYKGLHRVGI